jgi:hypothetical protein
VFGFSGELSRKVHYREEDEILLILILLLPLILHYAMVVFSSLNIKPSQNQTKQNSESQFNTHPLIFKNNQSAFEYACKFMDCKLKQGAKIPALVVEEGSESSDLINNLVSLYQKITSKKTWHLHLHSPLNLENGYQNTILKVASSDGGFYVVAEMGEKNMNIKPNDFVMWSADIYLEDLAKTFIDKRFGWCGLVLKKLEPHFDIKNGWKISKDDGSDSSYQP